MPSIGAGFQRLPRRVPSPAQYLAAAEVPGSGHRPPALPSAAVRSVRTPTLAGVTPVRFLKLNTSAGWERYMRDLAATSSERRTPTSQESVALQLDSISAPSDHWSAPTEKRCCCSRAPTAAPERRVGGQATLRAQTRRRRRAVCAPAAVFGLFVDDQVVLHRRSLRPRRATDRCEGADRNGIGVIARHCDHTRAVRALPGLMRSGLADPRPAVRAQRLADLAKLLGRKPTVGAEADTSCALVPATARGPVPAGVRDDRRALDAAGRRRSQATLRGQFAG